MVADRVGIENVPELDCGPFPDILGYMIDWWNELDAARRYTESGPCPISFTDIMDWKSLYSVEINAWEVRALRSLDEVYIRVISDAAKKKA